MRALSTGPEFGIVSVGQEAFGVLAIGQFARGFIAIGQIAIGVFALGQGVVSVVGLGQGGIGVTWFAGMLGVGGRGLCLRLIPGLDPPREVPAVVPFEQIALGPPGSEGFVKLEVVEGSRHPGFALGGRRVNVKPSAAVSCALANARAKGFAQEVYAHVRHAGTALVCTRVMEIPGMRRQYGPAFQALRIALLCVVGVGWWYAMTVKM